LIWVSLARMKLPTIIAILAGIGLGTVISTVAQCLGA